MAFINRLIHYIKQGLPKEYQHFFIELQDILRSTKIVLKQARFKEDHTRERKDLISAITIMQQNMQSQTHFSEELWNYCHTVSPRVVYFLNSSESFDTCLDLGYYVTIDVPWDEADAYVDCFVEHVDERRKREIFRQNILQRECFSISGVFTINLPTSDCKRKTKMPIVIDEELEHTVFYVVANDGHRWEKKHVLTSPGPIHNLLQDKYVDFEANKMVEFYVLSDYQETITNVSPETGLHFTTIISPGLSVDIEPQHVQQEVEMNFKIIPALKAAKKLLDRLRNQTRSTVVRDISDSLVVSYTEDDTQSLPAKLQLPFNQRQSMDNDEDEMASDDDGDTVLTRCVDDVEILGSDFVNPDEDKTVDLKCGRYQLLKVKRNWKDRLNEVKDTVLRLFRRTVDCQLTLMLIKTDVKNIFTVYVDVAKERGNNKDLDSNFVVKAIYKTSAVILLQEKDQLSIDCGGMFSFHDNQCETSLMFLRNAMNRLRFTVTCGHETNGSVAVCRRKKSLNVFEISRQMIITNSQVITVVLDSSSPVTFSGNLTRLAASLSLSKIYEIATAMGMSKEEAKKVKLNYGNEQSARKGILSKCLQNTDEDKRESHMKRALDKVDIQISRRNSTFRLFTE